MNAYYLASTMWSIGGFIGGFDIGWVTRHSNDETTRGRRWPMLRNMSGVLLLVILAWLTFSTYQVNACQAQYNKEFREGLAARAEAQTAYNRADAAFVDAQRRYLVIVTSRQSLWYERDQALKTYFDAIDTKQASLQAIEQARAVNPISPVLDCPLGDAKDY